MRVCVCVEWSGESGDISDSEPTVQNTVATDIFHRVTSLECHASLYSELLQERSVEGHTPFMAAITYKVLHIHQKLFFFQRKIVNLSVYHIPSFEVRSAQGFFRFLAKK